MPESAATTARLTKFYSELSPSLETVKAALTAAGVDPDYPRASDLYQRDIDCHNLGMYRMLVVLAEESAPSPFCPLTSRARGTLRDRL